MVDAAESMLHVIEIGILFIHTPAVIQNIYALSFRDKSKSVQAATEIATPHMHAKFY